MERSALSEQAQAAVERVAEVSRRLASTERELEAAHNAAARQTEVLTHQQGQLEGLMADATREREAGREAAAEVASEGV